MTGAMTFENGALYLTRFRDISVWLHWTWFVVAVLQVTWRADKYSSALWNVLEYLTLFVIVLLHEFGHALACRSVGGVANKILLWPLGGVAFVAPPQRPGAHLWSIAAGPLVNLALMPLIGGAWFLVQRAGGAETWPQFNEYIGAVFLMNAFVFVFNMLPVFPLDGGQILRALLWFVAGRLRSLQIAAAIGLVGTVGFGVLGILWRDWWYVVLAFFGGSACIGTLRGATAQIRALALPRREGFACPSCGAAPPTGAHWRCTACRADSDVFVEGGVCPRCATAFPSIPCIECTAVSASSTWVVGGAPGAVPSVGAVPSESPPSQPS